MESEKQIEAYLIKQVEKRKGLAYKWVSPGNCGVPDRILFLPGGVVIPVELKAPDKEDNLSPMQKLQITKIGRTGTRVYVLSTRTEVDRLMQKYDANQMISRKEAMQI